MVKLQIIFLFSLLIPTTIFAGSNKEYCPITSEYLISQLNEIEKITISSSKEQLAPFKDHALRMATEALTNHEFKNNKKCEYFFISVNLGGMESEKKEIRAYNYIKLMEHVKKCKKWVSNKFPNPKKELESESCK